MVSKALSALMDWAEDKQSEASDLPSAPYEPADINAAALINELDFLGCEIALRDGRPIIRGNKAAVTPDLLALLKAGREQIIKYLTAQASPDNEQKAALEPPQPDPLPAEHDAQSGIRRNPETGKLHLFGDPSPHWLREQGWEWNERRRRFTAPYPFDQDDPPPRFMVGGGPSLPADYPEIIFEPHDKGAA